MTAERDSKGRWAVGNRGGPGNPAARRAAELSAAFRAAVTPKDLATVAAKLLAMAQDGDVQAASLLLTRALGRPREEPEVGEDGEPGLPLSLGDLGTPSGVAAAMQRVVHAMTAGTVDTSTAGSVLVMLEAVGRGHERMLLEQMDERLARLEADRERSLLQ